jgi:hypothetical protein
MDELIRKSTEVLLGLNEGVKKTAEFVPDPRGGTGEVLVVPVGMREVYMTTGGALLDVELFVNNMQILGLKHQQSGRHMEFQIETKGLTKRHIDAIVNGFDLKKTYTRKTSKFVIDEYKAVKGIQTTSVFILSKGSKIVGMYVSNLGEETKLNILDTAYGI